MISSCRETLQHGATPSLPLLQLQGREVREGGASSGHVARARNNKSRAKRRDARAITTILVGPMSRDGDRSRPAKPGTPRCCRRRPGPRRGHEARPAHGVLIAAPCSGCTASPAAREPRAVRRAGRVGLEHIAFGVANRDGLGRVGRAPTRFLGHRPSGGEECRLRLRACRSATADDIALELFAPPK